MKILGISYTSLHARLRRENPKTGTCEHCGKSARTEYALKPGREYSLTRGDYKELCRPCHAEMDGIYDPDGPALAALRRCRERERAATVCKRGHAFTEENTYRDRKGRQCRECRRLAMQRFQAKRTA